MSDIRNRIEDGVGSSALIRPGDERIHLCEKGCGKVGSDRSDKKNGEVEDNWIIGREDGISELTLNNPEDLREKLKDSSTSRDKV